MRVARLGDGSLAIGRDLPGRGAWVCGGTDACLREALRRRRFGRALRADIPAEAVTALLAAHPDRFPVGGAPARD